MIAAAVLVPFALSVLLTVLLIRQAPRIGLVDQPGARKVHTRPTPKGGGLAIYAAFVLAVVFCTALGTHLSALGPRFTLADSSLFLLLGSLIVVLGLLDDRFNLPWQLRLSVQTAVAVGAVVWLVPPSVLSTQYSVLSVAAAVLWIVALINAFNMLDNMDALSAGTAGIAAGMFLLALVLREGASDQALPYVMLIGALTGFLCFNRPPARIFMGDAGSTFLGFFFGVRSLSDGFINPDVPRTWLVPVCVLAVPIYDQATVVALRLWQGRSPFHADKQHLSHRLVALGLSQPAAVGMIYLLGLASAAVGLTLPQVSEGTAWLVVAALVVGWSAVAAVEYVPHFRR